MKLATLSQIKHTWVRTLVVPGEPRTWSCDADMKLSLSLRHRFLNLVVTEQVCLFSSRPYHVVFTTGTVQDSPLPG